MKPTRRMDEGEEAVWNNAEVMGGVEFVEAPTTQRMDGNGPPEGQRRRQKTKSSRRVRTDDGCYVEWGSRLVV